MEKQLWEKCVEFHGHECPGLAIGFRAFYVAKEKLNLNFSKDEEIVCVTENDACGVDAIQVLSGSIAQICQRGSPSGSGPNSSTACPKWP